MKKKIIIGICVCLFLTFLICSSIIIYFLLTKTPDIVNIQFNSPEMINITHNPLWIKAVKTNDAEYIFYSANEGSSSNATLFYMKKENNQWSDPFLLELGLPIYYFFDCFFDENKNEFCIFFCHRNESGCAIYFTRGLLDSLGPIERVTEYPDSYDMNLFGKGATECSAFISQDGTIYLVYCWITGVTENLNDLFITSYKDQNWSEPQMIGTGNSPHALQDKNGDIYVYSNLWTYTNDIQYCVDEWKWEKNKWNKDKIKTSAQDDNVDPFVIEDSKGTKYLLYDHEEYREESKTNLLLQTKRNGESWSNYRTIVKGNTEYGIQRPCATISNKFINIYYIKDNKLFSLIGEIE